MTPEDARTQAEEDIANYIDADSHRILMVEGTPVAMTGFNATQPEAVQVGGVYTPPELRRRGYGRLAVALHLAEARQKGATRAILFSAGPAATRAYEALGFQHIGAYGFVLFDGPQEVRPAEATP